MLSQIAELSTGASAPQEVECYDKGTVPFVRTADVGQVHYSINFKLAGDYLKEDVVRERGITIFKKDTILIPKSGASTFLNHRVILGMDAAVSSHLATIHVTEANNKFVFYALCLVKAENLTQNAGYPSLRLSDLGDCEILLASEKEQERIAEILITLDEAIQETEGIITSAERLKKGLMQTILVKGIPGRHKKFKRTNVGEIPEDWEVITLDEILDLIKSGLSRLLNHGDVGVPCIRSTNIIDGKIDASDLKYWYWEDDQGADVKTYVLDEGDILINFINSLAQIGKSCVYHDIGRKVIYTTNLFRIKVNQNRILSEYFYYYTLTSKYQRDIVSITKPAVNQASFTSSDFRKLSIALPSLPEQRQIVTILSTLDLRIKYESCKKAGLETLKKSLMQKLLSGEIRVKVEEN